MRIRQNYRKWLPYLVYGVLGLAILGPLLFPGYILTLDMLFAPNKQFPGNPWGLEQGWTWISPCLPLYLLVKLANFFLPGWLIQKVLLFTILFFAGLGAHRLNGSAKFGAYFTGILYVLNPFTYTRFLAGQWAVLWAYALAPFAILAFIHLLRQGGVRNAIKVALLTTLLGLPHIMGIFLLALAYLIILIMWVILERKDPKIFVSTLKFIAVSAGLFFLINIYWVIPVLSEKVTVVNQISQADLLAFATQPSSTLGVIFDTASMYGFWRGGYIYTNEILHFWWVFFIFILFLAIFGLMSKLEDTKQRWVPLSFGAIGIVSFFLALGAASRVSGPVFVWLWDHFIFFRGFRDSQKSVAMLCLSYAYLGGLAINEFIDALRRQRERLRRIGITIIIGVSMLTPLIYSFTMFGFHSQLGATEYPKEWCDVNQYLNMDKDDFNVLFLPWHMYLDFNWIPNKDKRTGNLSRQFFDKPIIAGDNIEAPGIYSQSTNPISKYVEFLLNNETQIENLGELLAPLNVKYVIMVHEADYNRYNFLYHQNDLSVELVKSGITLFKNEHATSKVYAVDSLVQIDSLEEYLKLSKTQDVNEHLYVFDTLQSDSNETGMQKLGFTQKSPVRYKVEKTEKNYTVFIVPQNVSTGNWIYNGEKPQLANLGFMPVFQSSDTGGDIVYTRFYWVYLPSYVISATGLGLAIWLYFRKSFRP
jgi:hypothetical protein